MAHVIELFVANHCPTCPEARARVRQFAAATPDVVVIEHNVDESLERAVSYGLFATPAVVIDGEMVLYGVPSLAKLVDRCNAVRTQRSPAKVAAPRRSFLAGASKAPEPAGDRHLTESSGCKHLDELCFQQSAGDSTGPQIDIAQRVIRQNLADDDVGDLYASARFEDAGHLGDRALLLRHEVEDTVRDDDIDAAIVNGHASIQQTQRYVNVTDEELRKGLEVSWGRQLRAVSGQ